MTHDQVEAMTMSGRVAILNEGYLQQVATPAEIYNKPANVFVAGFMGSPPMNFLPCRLVLEQNRFFLESPNFKINVTYLKEKFDAQSGEQELILGVRPEDIRISKTQIDENCIKARIFVTEPLGSQVLVTLLSGEDPLKVMESADFEAKEGEEVWLKINMKKMHVFEKKSGRVIA